jgi:hypothetical protein
MKAFNCLLLLSFFSGSLLLAQPNLVLTKPGSSRHYFYQVGDRITFQARQSREKLSGIIVSLNDSTIVLSRAPRMNIHDIRVIYRTRPFLAQAAGAGVIVLGVYVPISILNRAFQHERPLIDDDLLLVNGTMLGVSAISWLFLNKKIRIGNPWKIAVYDFGKPVYK